MARIRMIVEMDNAYKGKEWLLITRVYDLLDQKYPFLNAKVKLGSTPAEDHTVRSEFNKILFGEEE